MKIQIIILSSLMTLGVINATATDVKKGKESNDIERVTPKADSYYILNYNIKSDKIGVKGYSIVSYIEKGLAEKGSKEFQVIHDDVIYNFLSNDQVELFKANPEKYLPKYGGYCAYGVLNGIRLDVSPMNFKVINEKIYLFAKNEKIDALAAWNKKRNETKEIEHANIKWAVLKWLL